MTLMGGDDEAAKQAWLARLEAPSWGTAAAPDAEESVAEGTAAAPIAEESVVVESARSIVRREKAKIANAERAKLNALPKKDEASRLGVVDYDNHERTNSVS